LARSTPLPRACGTRPGIPDIGSCPFADLLTETSLRKGRGICTMTGSHLGAQSRPPAAPPVLGHRSSSPSWAARTFQSAPHRPGEHALAAERLPHRRSRCRAVRDRGLPLGVHPGRLARPHRPARPARGGHFLALERGREVRDQIPHVLDADRVPHEPVRDPGRLALGLRDTRMGHRCGCSISDSTLPAKPRASRPGPDP